MMINQLREQRAAKVAAMKTLLDAASSANRDLNDDETKQFDTLKTEERSLQAQIERHAHLASIEVRTAEPAADTKDNLEKRVSLLNVIRAGTEGRALTGAELEYTQEAERRSGRKAQGAFVPMAALEKRANTTTTAPQLVPTDHRADQYIGPLRENLLARKLGVRVLSGLTGDVVVPKYGSGLETGWVSEGGAVPESDMAFSSVSLKPKHVGGKTEMSRQLIMQSSPDIESLVRDDLSFLIAKQIDRAIIAGTGTNNEPLGILHAAGTQTGMLSATPTYAEVMAIVQQLEDKEIFSGAWLADGSAKTQLATRLREAGLPGYLLENGQMANYPFYVTRELNDTLILGDFSQVLLGIWSELDILVNPYAEPAYSRGGVQVRAMATVDVAVRHPEAFVITDLSAGE